MIIRSLLTSPPRQKAEEFMGYLEEELAKHRFISSTVGYHGEYNLRGRLHSGFTRPEELLEPDRSWRTFTLDPYSSLFTVLLMADCSPRIAYDFQLDFLPGLTEHLSIGTLIASGQDSSKDDEGTGAKGYCTEKQVP